MEKKTNTKIGTEKEKKPSTKKQTNVKAKKVQTPTSRRVMFTKDMTLGEVIAKKPEAQAILFGFGMHCFGCPVTQFETIEEAAVVHDVDLKLLLKKLNEN